MWHWEVVFKDAVGNIHILFGKVEWEHWQEAVEDHEAHSKKIDEYMRDNGAVLVLEETIIYESR